MSQPLSPKPILLLLLVLLWALPTAAQADDGGVPDIVLKGFVSYQKYGAISGINDWLKGSPFEQNDKDLVSAKITRVETAFGRFTGCEPFRTVKLSPSTRRIYVAVKYEKGAAWMFFDCYKTDADWIILRFDFSTKPEEVLPPGMLDGQ